MTKTLFAAVSAVAVRTFLALQIFGFGFVLCEVSNAQEQASRDLIEKAHALVKKRHETDALGYLNSLISKEPRNARAYRERAAAYLSLGLFDKALEDCNKDIFLAPRSSIAYATRAQVYIEKDDYKKALADCSRAIALDPRLSKGYSMRACAYGCLSDYKLELDAANKAIALEPKEGINYAFRAEANRELGNNEVSMRDANKAVTLSPKEAVSYVERGHTFIHLHRYQLAIADFSTAIAMNPRTAQAYRLRAFAHHNLGQYQKEVDDLTSAIKLRSKDGDSYMRRGDANFKLWHRKDAIDDYDTAAELNHLPFDAYGSAGELCEETGEFDRAVEYWSKCLSLRKNSAMILTRRAHVYECLGKPDLARADWTEALKEMSNEDRLKFQACYPFFDFDKPAEGSQKQKLIRQLEFGPVVLPFTFDRDTHIAVPANVNGHPVQMMFDTGSGHTDMWKSAMTGVAQAEGWQRHGTMANGKEYSYGWFRAKNFKLGRLAMPNTVMDISEGLVGNTKLGGYLGGNILEYCAVRIDYAKKEITLANTSSLNQLPNSFSVPMMIRHHCPYCNAKIHGANVAALLDTGCSGSIAPDALVEDRLPWKPQFRGHVTGPWLGVLRSEMVRFQTLELGGRKIDLPILEIFMAADGPQAASSIVLGNDFLSRFKSVTFDYPARRVIFEPNLKGTDAAPKLYVEGRFYQDTGELQRAVDTFSKVIAIDKDYSSYTYYLRGKANFYLGKFQEAINDFDKVIGEPGSTAYIFIYRGCALAAARKYDMAIDDFSKVLLADPKSIDALEDRAWVYEKIGKHDLAKADRAMSKKIQALKVSENRAKKVSAKKK